MSASNNALVESDDSSPMASFNPFTPEFCANPYPHYHQLRVHDPVHWQDATNTWNLTRYANAVAVLKDQRFGRNTSDILPPEQQAQIPEAFQPLFRMFNYWLAMYNPPQHGRLQKVLQERLTRKHIESLSPYIESIVTDKLDIITPAGEMDFITDFARDIPLAVIAKLLGVPIEMCPRLDEWSASILRAADLAPKPADLAQAAQTVRELYDYFRQLADVRRRQPQDDLISTLVAAQEQGDILDEEELLANCAMMVMAGGETTASVIGTGMLSLLRNPDQLEKLRTDPTLYRSAVEEFLRYEPPVQMTHRVAFEDIDFAGKTIRKGQRVNIWLGAVNRDPAQFPDPDQLDLARTPNVHLSFGHGIHGCIGPRLSPCRTPNCIQSRV